MDEVVYVVVMRKTQIEKQLSISEAAELIVGKHKVCITYVNTGKEDSAGNEIQVPFGLVKLGEGDNLYLYPVDLVEIINHIGGLDGKT